MVTDETTPTAQREPKLIQNALWCKEDDVYIASWSTHDFRTHTFKDGRHISVDGGLSYTRREGDLYTLDDDGAYEEKCLKDSMSFEEIADKLLWGTRGRDGKSPLAYRPIKEFTPEHLAAILFNCPARNEWANKVVRYWLEQKTKASSV